MMTQAELWWSLAGAAAAAALVAALADRARQKRRNLDKPGWMPWAGIQVAAMLLAVVAIALALKS